VTGLCIAARETDYIRAVVAASDTQGPCTALGHAGGFDAAGAALVNGTAAHGEDFDDTFEGTPVHPGAVAVPALLAACESHTLSGADLQKGIAIASELMCRLALVAPTAQHRAGFHPTAVLGGFGAAAGVGAALGLSAPQIAHALGIAGSMASGIIEYLAEGAWTKRLHPGWAAQAGYRAARLAQAGFTGPRTVFEGTHGFFSSFGVTDIKPDFVQLTDGLGADWHMTDIAFKPYACGTICQPFIDAAISVAEQGVNASAIAEIRCKVGEGTVHRLWEPRAEKAKPTTPYSAKFSVPYCVAVGMFDRAAGLAQYTDARIADPGVLNLADMVHYEIDPADPYPASYVAHLTVTLKDGRTVEADQPHLRGGRNEPLSDETLAGKFTANVAHGGWPPERAAALEQFVTDVFDRDDLSGLAAFRG
jgi:2-methylcitrate dehydratase PrpD